jgi:hypothetical protein
VEALAVGRWGWHLCPLPQTILSFLCNRPAADTQLHILAERILFPLHLLTYNELSRVHKVDLPLTIVAKFARACGTDGETISRVTCM